MNIKYNAITIIQSNVAFRLFFLLVLYVVQWYLKRDGKNLEALKFLKNIWKVNIMEVFQKDVIESNYS